MRQLDLFSALLFNTEGIDTEFKSARGGEHLMAFANHPGGGTLVFGVDDDGKLHTISP
jgi:predicted HTH transcriptional regulator